MDGVVLAAGEGSRLGALTADTPKALLEVGGRPILTRILDQLVALGVDRLVIVVGYRGDQIKTAYGDAYREVPIVYREQAEQLGMAHALLCAEDLLEDDFVVLDCDTLTAMDLSRLLEVHREPGVDGTLLVQAIPADRARRKARCRIEDDLLVGIENKPADPPNPCYIAAGVQTCPPAILEAARDVALSPRGEYEMTDAIEHLLADDHCIRTVACDAWHVNVNTPADLARARRLVAT